METASLSWELSFMDFAATDAFQIVSMAIQTNSIGWNRMRVRAAFKVEFVWKIHWQLCRRNSFSAFQQRWNLNAHFSFDYRHQENIRILSSFFFFSSREYFLFFYIYIFFKLDVVPTSKEGDEKKKKEYNICLRNLYVDIGFDVIL